MTEEFFNNETQQQRSLRAFEALVAGEDATIDLTLAALLIACSAYPDLDIAHYMAQLDSLAQRVREILGLTESHPLAQQPAETDLLNVITAMNQVLFDQEGFHGNVADYYNPSNSFLNDVLERHTGIPIALSLLYMEVGKRVGVQIDGIGLPLHFVVACRLPQGKIYIDPFEGGQVFSEEACHERMRRMLGGRGKIQPQWFEPVSHRQLLVRMLNNLKHIYLRRTEDYEQALAMSDHLVLLTPHAPLERRARGVIHLHLKHYNRALQDLTTYLELAPDAEDSDEVQRQVKTIRQIMAMMN